MSSKRSVRRRECGHKRRLNRTDAVRLCGVLMAKDHVRMRAYHCPWCAAWHVGHRP